FQAEDGIRDRTVTGVQTCALPISAQNLSGVLAVRSSGVEERQQEDLSGVLAEQQLAAAIHADGELARGTRHLLTGGQSGHKRERSEERRVGKECRGGWETEH